MSSVLAKERSEYKWVQMTPKADFAPRDGAGALTFHGRMWLLGGWSPEDKVHFPRICNNEVWSSEDGAHWRLEKPGTFGTDSFDSATDWEGRHCAGYVVFQDRMWIVGGDTNQEHYQYDVWNSSDGRIWTHVNKGRDVPWGPRALHHTCAFKGKLWVMGGQTIPHHAPAEERFYDDIWNSSDGIHWERVAATGPRWSARGAIGGSVVFKGRIWILGGGAYWTENVPEPERFHDVWSSSDGIHWERHLERAPWLPRQYHDVAVFDGRMWVMEGGNPNSPHAAPIAADTASRRPEMAHWISTSNLNDVWYSADGVKWRELPNTPWAPRHAASVFVHDNALWIAAGNNMESDVWKLVRRV